MNHNITRLTLITIALYGICCALALGQTVADENQAAAAENHRGSLLRAGMAAREDPGRADLAEVSFFAVPAPEPRTVQRHDLVTIIVREQSEFSSDGSSELRRQAEIDARIQEFLNLNLARIGELEGAPSIDASASRSSRGQGSVDRSDSLTARITAEVFDVRPNGTLVLQARKRIQTDDEIQQFILTGVCRAEDISADNTVLSTQIYDLELQKKHTGTVRSATRRGLIPRLLDVINPF